MEAGRLHRILDAEIATAVDRISAALSREGFSVVGSLDLAEVVDRLARRDARPLVVLSVVEPTVTAAVTARAPSEATQTVLSFTLREISGGRVVVDGPDEASLARVARCGRIDEAALVHRIGRAIRVH